MIKKFFLNLLSSFIGAWLAIVLGVLVIVVLASAIIAHSFTSGKGENIKVKSHSVLVLNLKGEIVETEVAKTFDLDMLLDGEIEKPQTLLSIVTALNEACEDPRIEAIYVKCNGVSMAPATAHAIHDALKNFKTKTERPIIVYGDIITQSALYISACADSIFLNPQGNLFMVGCGSSSMFFKDLCEKIGIQWQVAKVGTYKSAVEPFTSTTMSEPARRQLMELYDAIWGTMRKGIADGRKVSEASIDSLTNSLVYMQQARDIVKTGLISATAYEREMDKKIGAMLNVAPDDINFIDANAFGKANAISAVGGKQHIAVLYATGEIQENEAAGIDCYRLVPIITELADNDDVAGLVLRVNSPGGSIFGSEQISDALSYFKATGKPFVVSMGDYAASGGYWISCDAERIFADPLTVTGSIGVFGLIPNAEQLLQKVGVSIETVATNPNSYPTVPFRPLNEIQLAAVQASVEKSYTQFVNRVANGRRMKTDVVDSIAQGRVWIGSTAKKIGLVDELGSLQQAINYVSELIKDKNIAIEYYPAVEPSFWDLIPESVANSQIGQLVNSALDGKGSPVLLWHFSNILKRNHQQAIMPEAWRVKI